MNAQYHKYSLFLLATITLVTRLPFLFDGYGVEEDSWGLVVNAFQMHDTGHYVASRFPGHPLQEYVYSFIYNQPAWIYNSWSVVMSMVAVSFFYCSLRKMQFQNAFLAAIAFSFVPCFFIAGTYTIDFAWSMAFVMASLYYVLSGKNILAGVLIGMAIGCRITSGIFLIPWILLLFTRLDLKTSFLSAIKLVLPAALIGLAWYIPAYLNYGASFFDYSDQFPYPPLAKVVYKGSIGVFGALGMIALLFFAWPALNAWGKRKFNGVTLFSPGRLITVCLLIILLHLISYLRLPQKSGYLIPIIPFTIILFGTFLTAKQFRNFCWLLICSPFLIGINLTDPLRGSQSSLLATRFHVAGQEIFLDPLTGPAVSERSKRINKMKYCRSVIEAQTAFDYKNAVISGWWYNEIQTYFLQRSHQLNSDFVFYSTCAVMDSLKQNKTELYFLPEQDIYNDEMFGQKCTDSMAQPFPIK